MAGIRAFFKPVTVVKDETGKEKYHIWNPDDKDEKQVMWKNNTLSIDEFLKIVNKEYPGTSLNELEIVTSDFDGSASMHIRRK